MASISVFAPAKINLFLHVTGKRPDGYHLLESLVAFANIGDVVTVAPADSITLTITGPYAKDLNADDHNSVLKAARLLRQINGLTAGVSLTLTKNLPIASGIGGGSSDAAATLRAIQRLQNLERLPTAVELASELGADVPVCVHGQPVLMQGIGETLQNVHTFPSCDVVLINPGVALATADIFRALQPPYSTSLTTPVTQGWPNLTQLADFLHTTRNDLTPSAQALAPEIQVVVEALTRSQGCVLARMSGSGATCFGLFQSAPQARQAIDAIAAAQPTWWIKGGTLGPAQPRPDDVSSSDD